MACSTPGVTCPARATGQGTARGSSRALGGSASPRPTGAGAAAPQSGPTLTGWPRAIAWGEFSELDARPAGEKEDAQISSQLKQPDQVAVAQEHGQFKLGTYTARMMVERTESWVVKTQKTDELLQHEQGHYDITGLTARDLVADLKALRKPTTNELGTALQDLIAKTQELGDRLTKEYDTDTDHSRRKDRQVKWNQHLAALKQSGARLTAGPQ